ncbi:MAG: 30S ribosomal protein S18 [Bacteriovoracaceae bacterium]|jgi:ribosomal protein S18/ribosomal protein S6|nr:30S ribosomal protein S18 [Bacteriovoracaceae bacterium]|tara:strand:+ start:121 stop:717 length:597 start_codon:yes stop_codon:yes gene_type:complete
MIYESAYVLRPEAGEEVVKKMAEVVQETVKSFNGEILVEDNWGTKSFAQPTSNGIKKGQYIYFMYKAGSDANKELERRFRISEDVLKFVFISLGEEKDQEEIIKSYKNPNHSSGEASFDAEKEKKMFSKRKSCYFSAKKTQPDWKDPSTYSWLVNEFGKISPARVTGLRPKYQRMATSAIKRGRCMGLISYMSNRTAR